LNDFGEWCGDSVDGEVTLAKVFCDDVAFEWSNVEDDFVFFLLDDNAAGFFVEVDVVASEFSCECAC
jgi:hypothetical protein